MSLSEKDIAEIIKRCTDDHYRPKMPEEEKSFMERLANSRPLHYRLKKAKIKKQQVTEFISHVLMCNLDYSVFKKRLDDAKRDQLQVQRKAAALATALDKLYGNPCVTSELRYQHNFIQSLSINTRPKGILESITPLSSMVERITHIAANAMPKESSSVAAALSSRKKSNEFALRQFAAALFERSPKSLQKTLSRSIASVVSIRYEREFRSDNALTILRDLRKKNRVESRKKTVDSRLSGLA